MIVCITDGALYFGPGESGRIFANSCSSFAVTLTAITKLQPLLTSTSAGTLLTNPPSTSACPLRQMGADSSWIERFFAGAQEESLREEEEGGNEVMFHG